LGNEVFCFRGNVFPGGCPESELALFDFIEDVLVGLSKERRSARQHHKSDHTDRPDVALLIVIFL
jgi:hypothetical protein